METSTEHHSLAVGTRIEGTYCDVPVSGVVTDTRGHTINWNATVCTVALDEPIVYGGTERLAVMFQVDRIGPAEFRDNYGSRVRVIA